MACSKPCFFVLHSLLEFVQTYVHWVNDAIQPSHPLSPPSPPALNLSQISGSLPMSLFFVSCGQSIGAPASASVLPMNIQSWFPLGLTGLILLSQGLQESFPALQLESINSLAPSLLYGPTLIFVHDYWKKHSFDYMTICQNFSSGYHWYLSCSFSYKPNWKREHKKGLIIWSIQGNSKYREQYLKGW